MEVDLHKLLTLFRHSDIKAFLQPTGLTPVPRHFIYDTHFVSVARVHHVLLDAPTKETLPERNGGSGSVEDNVTQKTVPKTDTIL